MKNPPTERQQAILAFITARIRAGAAPTRGEIAARFGFASRFAAEQHLRALAAKGLIRLQAKSARGISLPEGGRKAGSAEAATVLLPLIGRVAAGSPLLANEHVERQVVVDASVFWPRADYLLRVLGESMREQGIRDGDWLAVHRQAHAEHGQIVVARIDDEVTVKRLHHQGGRILLLPANPDFAPIPVDPGRAFAIEGLAVGVLRTRIGA